MSKKELLDPIGSLCRLVTLAFLPKGTKIRILNHTLILDKPEGLQFMYRMINGDTRDNVSEIYDVIVRLLKWYTVNNENIFASDMFTPDETDAVYSHHKNYNYSHSSNVEFNIEMDDGGKYSNTTSPFKYSNLEDAEIDTLRYTKITSTESSNRNCLKIQNSEEIKKMLRYLVISLDKLRTQTYSDGNVTLALQFYINIITMSLDGIFDEKYLPKELEQETLLDYNKLKNLWKLDELNDICRKYEECFKILGDKQNCDALNEGKFRIIYGIIDYIDVVLNKKNSEFQKLIKNSTG